MRGTIFTKSKMNYFGSFGRQRIWAALARGAVGRVPLLNGAGEARPHRSFERFVSDQQFDSWKSSAEH